MRFSRLLPTMVVAACFSVGCGDGGSGAQPPSGEIEAIAVTAGGFTFDALAAGPTDGEGVLLLHGFPQSAAEYRNQLTTLGLQRYRAVAPNQRGYSAGARPSRVADYDIGLLVADVLGIADALGFERFHLVGHDWGAVVSWAVAEAAPQRLLSLTPISVPHPSAFAAELADRDSCQYAASAYVDFLILPGAADLLLGNNQALLRGVYSGLPEDNIDAHLAVLGSRDALDAALHWYRANFNGRDGLRTTLPPTRVPTMHVWSDGDTALCREGAARTGDYVAAPYRFDVIAGVNHWVPELAADALNALLLEHFANHGAAD